MPASVAARWAQWERAGRRLSSAPQVPPITFPSTPLKVKVEVALGADLTANPATWGWTDATGIIYTRDGMTITRGRADEGSTADSCSLAMTADNRGGHWSTRNPNSPWFGLLRKGTPIRVFAEGYLRFTGFLSEIPPRWDVSGYDRHAALKARGLLYRFAQGASPARSAMARTILGSNPVQYWPLEDLESSTFGASATGGSAMAATNVAFGIYEGPTGSAMTPDLFTGPGTLIGSVSGGSATSWHVGFAMAAPYTNVVVARIYAASATHAVWRIALPSAPASGVTVFVGPLDGSVTTALFSAEPIDYPDVWHHYALSAEQSGSNIISRLYVDGVLVSSSTDAGILGPVSELWINHNAADIDSAAHAEIGDGVLAYGSPGALALGGFAGEQAHARFLRLCNEEGIPATTDSSESQAMAEQGVDGLVNLLRQCESVDQAFLFEDLGFGLQFQGHVERENALALLQLNYEAPGHLAPPLEPTDDDQRARNDVEITRDGGSSSRALEEDPLVELSIPNIGRRDESLTLPLDVDDQTFQVAGWRLHIGTWPGYRYPALTLDLSAAPSLIDGTCRAGLAFRATVANPPDDIGPDPVDVIVEGYTEDLAPFDWDITTNCSPFGPWRVHVMTEESGDAGSEMGWLDWDSCALASAVDATTTAFLINAVPLDTTVADDFPRSAFVDGEQVTVTACSGASQPQTWTVTRSVNGIIKAHAAGSAISLADPLVLTL